MSAKDKFYYNDSLKLYYQHYRPVRPPIGHIVCLPGLTRNHRDFEDIAHILSDRFEVICPELRGRGQSGYDDDISHYQIECYISDVLALLDTLALTKITFLGTSLGGIISMVIAGRQAERVAGVILNDIGAFVAREPQLVIADYVKSARIMSDWASVIDLLKQFNASTFTDLDETDWLAFAKRLYQRREDGMIYPDFDLQLADTLQPQDLDLWPFFDALLNIPTLLIRGANSPLLTDTLIKDMLLIKSDMQYQVIANRGHAPFLNESLSVAAIEKFLSHLYPEIL